MLDEIVGVPRPLLTDSIAILEDVLDSLVSEYESSNLDRQEWKEKCAHLSFAENQLAKLREAARLVGDCSECQSRGWVIDKVEDGVNGLFVRACACNRFTLSDIAEQAMLRWVAKELRIRRHKEE